jgi:UDP-N-acetylmuramoyl-L-alanyl-D-glutamate--2,6-diaminopimelate ligase
LKLSQLLSIYPQLKLGEHAAADVSGIFQNSQNVIAGGVFVAIKGFSFDGHNYLKEACSKGAIAVVVKDEANIPQDFSGAVVVVEDTRVALNALASRFQGSPAQGLFCVGITGTNGKTSVTYLVEHILNQFGWKVGVMGTIDHHMGNHRWTSQLTTPDALVLQKRLREFVSLGARACVFEVSSHALTQHRADNIPFDVVVFTNLSRDHLDYHADMEDYFHSKEKLFREIPLMVEGKSVSAVLNVDDSYGQRIQTAAGVRSISYGQRASDLSFRVLDSSFEGTWVEIKTYRGEAQLKVPLPGIHNVYNAMAAIGVALVADVALETCLKAIESFKGVPGRLQRVPNDKGINVFVDYAHTDDALRTVLAELNKVRKSISGSCRIITVFGCGGDRDRGKRPLMGEAAFSNSDMTFVTSDNPRSEEPQSIIDDVMEGLPKEELNNSLFTEVDRKAAIHRALNSARPGDVVLIAGKGHEDYQIVGDQTLAFSDYEVAKELLDEL